MTMKSESDTTRTRTLFTLAGDHRALNLDVLGFSNARAYAGNFSTRKPSISFGRFFCSFTSEGARKLHVHSDRRLSVFEVNVSH